MRIGYINYLNCYPFYYHMLEKEPLPGIEVVPAYPSALNDMMRRGALDMSPISSAAYADMQGDILVLPDFCLSSVGYVRSVVLWSRVPIEELDGRRLGLTSASQTSVVLLKTLLRKYYGIEPVYLPTTPSPSLEDIDAALVIGNEAMENSGEPTPYVYDLGDLWLRKTGHPVVFAVFAVQARAAARATGEIGRVIDSYNKSLLCLHTERETLIARAREKYPRVAYDIDTYYSLLRFEFTPDLHGALEFYFREAGSLGLLENVPAVSYYEPR
jgi:chorismate dehydratase